MKFFIAFAALVAIAVAAPAEPESEAKTILLDIDNKPDGEYDVK